MHPAAIATITQLHTASQLCLLKTSSGRRFKPSVSSSWRNGSLLPSGSGRGAGTPASGQRTDRRRGGQAVSVADSTVHRAAGRLTVLEFDVERVVVVPWYRERQLEGLGFGVAEPG